MAIDPNPVAPHRSVDARGRALPMTEEEIRRRNEEAIRILDSLDEIGDEEEQRATFEALLMKGLDEEPLSFREDSTMAIAPNTDLPQGDVDPATGRLRPLSDEESRARSEALSRALDEIAEITDETDTDEIWAEVFRGIDAARPHRPLFEGQY